MVFTFAVGTEIGAPWGSAIGLSVQTFHVYVDLDPGAGTGASELLEGRNARLQPGDEWEVAVSVEGWTRKILIPNAEGNPVELPENLVRAIVDGANGTITVLVPKSTIAEAVGAQPDSLAPRSWWYAGMVLSQEGFPSAGVRRVRDVNSDEFPVKTRWWLRREVGHEGARHRPPCRRPGFPGRRALRRRNPDDSRRDVIQPYSPL